MATKRRDTPKFIDLFAGIGGLRLAFEKAGAECVYSSEWDRFAQKTYAANFGDTPAGDVRAVSATDIPDFDILAAGFPCQPFSVAGVSKKNSLGRKHGFACEEQGNLFFEIVRLVEEKATEEGDRRPRALMLENVKNLQRHDGGNTWQVIMDALDKLGYDVSAKVLDARNYVPQHRERIIIVGFRRDLYPDANFAFPKPPHRTPRIADILEKEVDDRYTLSDHLWQYLQEYADKHRKAGHGFGYGLTDPETDTTTRTLSARYHKDGSEILIKQPGKVPRRLTPRECARLQGFPDSFVIPVSDTQAYRQFGNSVAVPMVTAVAREVVKKL